MGLVLVAVWLILTGLAGLGVPLPPAVPPLLPLLAVAAGVLVLVGR